MDERWRTLVFLLPTCLQGRVRALIGKLVLGNKRAQGFPGTLCTNVERSNMSALKGMVAMPKTDGTRAFFVIVDNMAVFVTRNMEMFTPREYITYPAFFAQGTIIDGELIVTSSLESEGKLNFLAFDILTVGGANVMHIPLLQRMELFLPTTIACIDFRDVVAVVPKRPYNAKEYVERYRYQLEHPDFDQVLDQSERYPSDGIIFCSPKVAYAVGRSTSTSTYKWKPPNRITVDLLLAYRDPSNPALGCALFCLSNVFKPTPGAPIRPGCVYVHDVSDVELLTRLGATAPDGKLIRDEIVVECTHSAESHTSETSRYVWTPYLVRTDKQYPNRQDVLVSTERSVTQNISLSELLAVL
jgi:hypothetical protein